MDILSIMKEIQEAWDKFPQDQIKQVLYVADKGRNSCSVCIANDGKKFNIDDPNLPRLPIHPHCRCKYVPVANPNKDESKNVEQHRIAQMLKGTHKRQDEEVKSLAEQVIKARNENSKLREQKLFLIFNGRYLMSSDGKLLLDAVSGKAVSSEEKINSATITGLVKSTQKTKFDYSYERQAVENKGGLPQGLYSISCKESGSLLNGNVKKHGRDWIAWGNYHWQLIPDENTDTRGRRRNSFTIHGGLVPGSAGCIDLTSNDTKFRDYLKSLGIKSIYVYVHYDKDLFILEDENNRLYPVILPRCY